MLGAIQGTVYLILYWPPKHKADTEEYERLRGKTPGADPLDIAGRSGPFLGR